MHIQLTTPYSVGDLDPQSPYGALKVIKIDWRPNENILSLYCQHGDDVSGTWDPGIKAIDTVEIAGTDYDTILAADPDEGESAFEAAERLLYQYLLDEAVYVGIIAGA